MRVFAVEGTPLRIVAEGVAEGPAISWDEDACLTGEQLLLTQEGRAALGAWRRGDDSVYEISEAAELIIGEAEDELVRTGLRVRPDLRERLGGANALDEIAQALTEASRAGVEALDPDD